MTLSLSLSVRSNLADLKEGLSALKNDRTRFLRGLANPPAELSESLSSEENIGLEKAINDSTMVDGTSWPRLDQRFNNGLFLTIYRIWVSFTLDNRIDKKKRIRL